MKLSNYKWYRRMKGGKWFRYFDGPDDVPINKFAYWLSLPETTLSSKLIDYEHYPWDDEDTERKIKCEKLEKEWQAREEAHKRLANKAVIHKNEHVGTDDLRFNFKDIIAYLEKTMPPKGFNCTGAIKKRLLFYLEGMGFEIDIPLKKYGELDFPDYGDSLVEDLYIELTKAGRIICHGTHHYTVR